MRRPPERIDLRDVPTQPWKNGAGLTREIAFGGESATDFDWRISLAEVGRDAPFSAFAGVDRCIVLLRGAGMRLRSAAGAMEPTIDHALTTPLSPFHFPGDVPLVATLVDGASSDFNVMTRRGVFHADVHCARDATTLSGGDATLLLGCAGAWQVVGGGAAVLGPLQALLWRDPIGALRVEPHGDAAALLVVRLFRVHRP